MVAANSSRSNFEIPELKNMQDDDLIERVDRYFDYQRDEWIAL